MKKYILWDHDGVLVDTERLYYEATIRSLGEIGIDIDKDTYLEFMSRGESLWKFASDANISKKVIDQKKSQRNFYYQTSLVSENIEIKGVEKVLEQLTRKFNMVIVTSARRADFELIHKNRNIVKYMDFVLTIEDYKNCKPAPDPYLEALEKLGASKEQAVVIEDSTRGLSSALSAGIECVIVDNEFTKSLEFKGASRVLKSIKELPAILGL